jgi:hypothetical protein
MKDSPQQLAHPFTASHLQTGCAGGSHLKRYFALPNRTADLGEQLA